MYGYLQEKYNKSTIAAIDKYFLTEFPKLQKKYSWVGKTHSWTRLNGHKDNLTLMSYIRNEIHHPENDKNKSKMVSMKKSIDFMELLLEK